MTGFIKSLERIYPWLLLAPVILPAIVWSGFIYPYLVPKTLLFYALCLADVAVFVLLVAYGKTFFWARLSRWETWIPALLLVVAYGTSLIGVDFYRSFWSLFVRGDGLLMLTCAVASFYLILLAADQAFLKRLLASAAVVASCVALYGIGEWLISGGRIGGLLGNAAFFAGYLGIAFFATLLVARSLSQNWRRAALIGAVLQVVAIMLTATRGTMLALAIAFVAFLVYSSFQKPKALESKNGVRLGRAARSAPFFGFGSEGYILARGILLALAVFGGLFFAFRSELAHVPFEPVARIASISASDADVASRLFIWKNMMTEIQKSPWVGVGAEHIDVLFNRFYDPTQISEQWFDRSHNAFLDYLAQYGIGGLLLYLALIGAFLTTAMRLARRGERSEALLLALLAVAYAVQNFFVFDTVSSFWLLLALLAVFVSASTDDIHRTAYEVAIISRPVSWVAAVMLLALIVPVSVRSALAAYDLSHAYLYQLVDVTKEVSYLSHGSALATYGDLEYGYEAYDMYANNQAASAALTETDRHDAYQAALAILTENFNRYTYDARTALYLAHVLSLAPRGVTIDENLLSAALTRAITESPKRSQAWYILTNLSISNANAYPVGSSERAAGYTAAHDLLAHYITLVPTLAAPYFVLAQLDYASGKTTVAAAEAEQGRVRYASDLETARRAAGYYENVLDLTNAAFFLAEIVRFDPADTAAVSDLAKIQAYEQSKR